MQTLDITFDQQRINAFAAKAAVKSLKGAGAST